MPSKQPLANSGFRGVTADRHAWKAQITVNGKPFNLGKFNDPEVAAYAYDEACLVLGRERPNKIEPAGVNELANAVDLLGWAEAQRLAHALMRIEKLYAMSSDALTH